MIKERSFFVFQTLLGSLFFLFAILVFLQLRGLFFFLPSDLTSSSFLEMSLLFIGIFFIREAVGRKNSGQRIAHFVVGLLVFLIAAFPLFVSLGILKALPYYIDLSVNPSILCLLILFSAGYMILDRIFLFIS